MARLSTWVTEAIAHASAASAASATIMSAISARYGMDKRMTVPKTMTSGVHA
jgi:hypothetical protein